MDVFSNKMNKQEKINVGKYITKFQEEFFQLKKENKHLKKLIKKREGQLLELNTLVSHLRHKLNNDLSRIWTDLEDKYICVSDKR